MPVKDRHLAWCVDLVERAEPALHGGPAQESWLARLEREHENCRAALRWSIEQGSVESGLRLAGTMRRFWDVRGYGGEGSEWLEAILQIDDGRSDAHRARAKAIVGSAILSYALNNYKHAIERAEQGHALCRQLGDHEGMADTLNVLGMIASDKEDLDSAAGYYSEALALYHGIGNRRRIAAMQCNLGNIAFFRGDYRQAIEMYRDALDLFRALGEAVALAMTLSNMGAAMRELGDLAQATLALEESAGYARQAGATVELAHALNNLGDVALRGGQYARSADLMRQSAELFQRSGDRRNVLVSLVVLAQALVGLEQCELAACLCGMIEAQCIALEISAIGSEWAGMSQAAHRHLEIGEVLG
jgi:tetratricopeptide (TPR) repeat protein